MSRLTERTVKSLLRRFKIPVSERIMGARYWGPAHELAHALVAPKIRRHQCGFGLGCLDAGHLCPIVPVVSDARAEQEERVAFLLTQWLLKRMLKRPSTMLREHTVYTESDTIYVGKAPWRAARRELLRKGLHPQLTVSEMEARLG